jgi:urea transport system substrate-binding protein
VWAYKLAAEKAGSVEADKILPFLGEVTVDGPRGMIKMDKQRHAALTMYMGQVQKDGSIKLLETFKDVDPGDQCPKLK